MEIPIFKVRASCGGKIMTEAKGKSNLELFNEAKEKLSSLKTRFDSFKNKECKSALDIKNNKIPATKKLIEELEKVKFEKRLSETCKTYLREWIISKKYDRKKEFSSKQTEKGNITEQDGFQLIQDVIFNGKVFMSKSKKYYEDEYFTGNLDIEIPKEVIDNKSSWDLFTFPIGEISPPDESNEVQIRIYMRLAKKEKGSVCYTLNNTPIHIIESELWKYAKANNIKDISEIPENKAFEICKNHSFTEEYMRELSFIYGTYKDDFIEIPKEKRVIQFKYIRDVAEEEKMIERVLECRKWINENWNKF